MKKNIGSLDRALRIIAALTLAVLYLTDQISGIAAILLSSFAIIFIVTSIVGFCPAYVPLKISTKKDRDTAF